MSLFKTQSSHDLFCCCYRFTVAQIETGFDFVFKMFCCKVVCDLMPYGKLIFFIFHILSGNMRDFMLSSQTGFNYELLFVRKDNYTGDNISSKSI